MCQLWTRVDLNPCARNKSFSSMHVFASSSSIWRSLTCSRAVAFGRFSCRRFLYGALLLFEFWGLFFPKHLLFLHGPWFMREIAEYEQEKLGKKQERNGRIVRLFAFTFIVIIITLSGNAAILYRIKKIDKEPGQFRWFTLKSLALGVILGLVSVALLSVGFRIVLNYRRVIILTGRVVPICGMLK